MSNLIALRMLGASFCVVDILYWYDRSELDPIFCTVVYLNNLQPQIRIQIQNPDVPVVGVDVHA